MKIKSKFSRRLILTGYSLFLAFLAIYSIFDYQYEWRKVQSFVMREIRSIALSTRPILNVDGMLTLSKEIEKDDSRLVENKAFEKLRQPLIDLAAEVGRGIPIYTLQIAPERFEEISRSPNRSHENATQFLLMSSREPFFKHRYDYKPEMAACFFEGEVVEVPPYVDQHGSWISVYVPLRSDSGAEVVSILEVDYRLDQLKSELLNVFFLKWGVLLVVGALVLILLYVISRRLSMDLEALTEQAKAYSEGKEDVRFGVQSGDEVQILSETLEKARSRQVLAQELLMKAKDRLEESDRNKEELINVLSHELRTPLNGIIGVTSLIEGEVEADIKKVLDRSLERMNVLIENVESYMLIDGLDLAVEKDLCAIQEVTHHWLLSKGFTEETVTFRLEVECLELQNEVFEKILSQLLDNAFKFSEGKGVVVGSGGNPFCVWVEDLGEIIPETSRENIFRPFYQVDMSLTREQEGLGMGLAIAKKYAMKVGGTLSYEEGSQGNRFVFRMPLSATTSRVN